MSTSKPQTKSSTDIELPVLTSRARSIQPPLERDPFSSPSSETKSDHTVEPPTPAYFPPSKDIPPIQTSDTGLLEYTRLHGHSEIPLSPRQRENDRNSIHASVASNAEALPAYKADIIPPKYSHSRHHADEPLTWPAISFRIGFLFPLFWFLGALTLITPQGSLDRIIMPWFEDFAPSANSYLDSLQTESEKEEYLARMRIAERRWAKWNLYAFSMMLFLIVAAAVIAVVVSRT